MSRGRVIHAADLFCGAGGTSTGLARACERLGVAVDLLAVNHWGLAVETHAAAHPWARHLCARIDQVDTKKAFPGGRLDLLVASPECTHHSIARGGKPVNDQSRASGWDVLQWVEELRPTEVLVENVKEWKSWGPIGANGKPLKSRRGETFAAWLKALRSLGYDVEHRVLNAADYGDPTTRERLFVRAHRGRGAVEWPLPSHGAPGAPDLFDARPWRTAREVIDWSIVGQSIFSRKKPLAATTLARIEEGLRRFGGAAAEPFLVLLRGTERSHVAGAARSIDAPVPTLCASGEHAGLAQPFVVHTTHTRDGAGRMQDVDKPLPTVTCANRGEMALVEPFILPQNGSNGPRSVDQPLSVVTTTSRGVGVVEPYLVPMYGEGPKQTPRTHSVDEPIPTIPASGGGKFGVVEPFVVKTAHKGGNGAYVRKVDDPLYTVSTAPGGEIGVVQPFILPHRQFDGQQVDSVDDPLRTIGAHNGGDNALVEPFVVSYYGQSTPHAVDESRLVLSDAARRQAHGSPALRFELGAQRGGGTVVTSSRRRPKPQYPAAARNPARTAYLKTSSAATSSRSGGGVFTTTTSTGRPLVGANPALTHPASERHAATTAARQQTAEPGIRILRGSFGGYVAVGSGLAAARPSWTRFDGRAYRDRKTLR